MEEPGSILVVSEKDETYTFLKTALSTYFKHIIRATSIAQAKQKLGKERIQQLEKAAAALLGD